MVNINVNDSESLYAMTNLFTIHEVNFIHEPHFRKSWNRIPNASSGFRTALKGELDLRNRTKQYSKSDN